MELPFAEIRRTERGVGLGEDQELRFGDKGKKPICHPWGNAEQVAKYISLVFREVVWTHQKNTQFLKL